MSLLENEEIIELELAEERSVCQRLGLKFFHFPINDYQTPKSFGKTFDFVNQLNECILNGERISIHCRQGIGRASLIAACILILQGVKVENIFDIISEKRGCQVPDTTEQVNWVNQFAGKLNERTY